MKKQFILFWGKLFLVAMLVMACSHEAGNNGGENQENKNENESGTENTNSVDLNNFSITLTFNDYKTGQNYQGIGPAINPNTVFEEDTKYAITVSGVSDTDISDLAVSVIDTSEAAGWWLPVIETGDFRITDITKNEKFTKTAYLKIRNLPVSIADTKIVFVSDKAKSTINLTNCSFNLEKKVSAVVKADTNGNATIKDISSMNLVKSMKIGWNLGNTLDAYNINKEESDILGIESETYWGEPKTTKEIIHVGKANGFDTIRIPVTSYNHIIDDKYTIDQDWFERVKQVVDWAIEDGYYVILNEHHSCREKGISDPLKYGEGYNVDDKDIEESERFLKAIWTQIGTVFNTSYDEHLIFETMNEPRDSRGNAANSMERRIEIVNEYNQVCLDAIRATGGLNKDRFVLIPGYFTYIYTVLGKDCADGDFILPDDSANDKLIVTVHEYCMGAVEDLYIADVFDDISANNLHGNLEALYRTFVEKDIPVIIGETGVFASIPSDVKVKWATALNEYAREFYMPVVLWETSTTHPERNGFKVIDRKNLCIYKDSVDWVKIFTGAE